jgi:hypothetical protein
VSDKERADLLYNLRHGFGSSSGDLAADLIEDQQKELNARKEILDGIAASVGQSHFWMDVLDWRVRLRDFACDSEQHQFDLDVWRAHHGEGVTLYANAGFFVGYYDDAAILWQESDDLLPMYHVMIKSDPPHRTVIHPLHLCSWVAHLAKKCVPVSILDYNVVTE